MWKLEAVLAEGAKRLGYEDKQMEAVRAFVGGCDIMSVRLLGIGNQLFMLCCEALPVCHSTTVY